MSLSVCGCDKGPVNYLTFPVSIYYHRDIEMTGQYNKRYYWIFGSALLCLLAAYLLFQRLRGSEGVTIEAPHPVVSDAYQEMTGVTFTEYVSGNKKMVVKAASVSIRPGKIGFFKTPLIKEAHMGKPELIFFAGGKEDSHITADSGKMNMGNKRVVLRGNVTLVTANGKRLFTEEMAVDPKHGLLSVNGKFTLDEGGDITKGKGLKSDIGLEKTVIK